MNRGRRSGPTKAAGRRNDNNRIYAHPLPLLFTSPDSTSTNSFSTLLGSLGLGGSRLEVLNPHCEGVFDPATRSVWVTNAKDSRILWTRGFFGKGNLSRSEPSWLARQVNARRDRAAGKCMSVNVSRSCPPSIHPRPCFFPAVVFVFSFHSPTSTRARSTSFLTLSSAFLGRVGVYALYSILIPCSSFFYPSYSASGFVNLNEITHAFTPSPPKNSRSNYVADATTLRHHVDLPTQNSNQP